MSLHIVRILHVAAASALLWPEVQSIWAYVISSWRRLFSQRAGAGGGFELRTAPRLECIDPEECQIRGYVWLGTVSEYMTIIDDI